MLLQQTLIGLLFIAAIGYLIFRFRKTFNPKKNGCGEVCGCGTIDIKEIEKKIEAAKSGRK